MTAGSGVSRRAWLGGALGASLWAWRGARAGAPALTADGFREFGAAPGAAPLAPGDAAPPLQWRGARPPDSPSQGRRAQAAPRQPPRRADDAELPGNARRQRGRRRRRPHRGADRCRENARHPFHPARQRLQSLSPGHRSGRPRGRLRAASSGRSWSKRRSRLRWMWRRSSSSPTGGSTTRARSSTTSPTPRSPAAPAGSAPSSPPTLALPRSSSRRRRARGCVCGSPMRRPHASCSFRRSGPHR